MNQVNKCHSAEKSIVPLEIITTTSLNCVETENPIKDPELFRIQLQI